MTELLQAIEAVLTAAGYRVEIVPDARAIPDSVQLPYVCLADGGETLTRDGLNEATRELTALVIPYHPALRGGDDVIGAGHRDGLLALSDAIHALLDDNLLGLANYEDAWPEPDAPVEIWGDESEVIIRRVQRHKYLKLETASP